jgi:amino acid transporter
MSATNVGSEGDVGFEVQSSRGQLRRELRLWEAIALSVAIMAPSLAVALNGVLPASIVGKHVPFVFVLSFAGVWLVAYSFVRLSRYFSHAGSVYALAGMTIGPRAGFFTGWALMGAYATYATNAVAGVGVFGTAFLRATGIWPNANWLLISLVAAGGMWIAGYLDVRVVTRFLLTIEGVCPSC